MSRARLIPCLLLRNNGLVKTTKFASPRYLGDPINAVRIFNELEADELVIFDIEKSLNKQAPDFSYIKKLSAECQMPFCYGGGVKSVEHALQLVDLGVEKISFSSVLFDDPAVLYETAHRIGSQSVVATLDVNLKKGIFNSEYVLTSHCNSRVHKNLNIENAVNMLVERGVGEIVINTVHRDGTMEGYDLNLLSKISDSVNVPITVLGGADSLDNIKSVINQFKNIGVGVSSLFVYKGRYNAVLINYPNKEEKLGITRFL